MQFDNMNGLYALLSIIPLIIIYLKRPKPVEKKIPSLMFIMKSIGFTKANRLFRKLIHNLVFILQLLSLLALSIAIAVPYMDVPSKYVAKHTVIILDVSASMQAGDRFVQAKKIAKQSLGGKNSILIVSQNPYLIATDVPEGRAKELIDQVMVTDSVTNLGSAILAAELLINDTSGRVVVISDFKPTLGMDPNEAKRILTSKNYDVEFQTVDSDEKNIGIINMEVGNDLSKITVKNYNDNKETIHLELSKASKMVDKVEITIPAYSVETAEFDTLPGESIVSIDTDDDFPVDNKAYISSPEKEMTDVLLITNQRYSNLELALRASPKINLAIEEPPRISSVDYDVIIFSKINANILLPGTADDVMRNVRNGASCIIVGQKDIGIINWFGLMPVALHNYLNESTINVDMYNKFSGKMQRGESGKYSTSNYFNASANNNTIVIASADDSSPLIAMKKMDKGTSVYYGINDSREFVLSQDYPVFWNNLVQFLVERGDISDYNARFTDYYSINITKQGIYNIQGKQVSINLLDEKESDISISGINKTDVIRRDTEEFKLDEGELTDKLSLEKYLLIAVLFFFIIEIYIIKTRGEL